MNFSPYMRVLLETLNALEYMQGYLEKSLDVIDVEDIQKIGWTRRHYTCAGFENNP